MAIAYKDSYRNRSFESHSELLYSLLELQIAIQKIILIMIKYDAKSDLNSDRNPEEFWLF